MSFVEDPMNADPPPQIEEILQIITLPIRRDSGLDSPWTRESFRLHSAFRTISKQPGWIRTLWDRDLEHLDRFHIFIKWSTHSSAHSFSISRNFHKAFSPLTNAPIASIQPTTFLLRSSPSHHQQYSLSSALHASHPTKTYTFSFPQPLPPPYPFPSPPQQPHQTLFPPNPTSLPSTFSPAAIRAIASAPASSADQFHHESLDTALATTLTTLFDPTSFPSSHTPGISNTATYIPPDLSSNASSTNLDDLGDVRCPLVSVAHGPSISTTSPSPSSPRLFSMNRDGGGNGEWAGPKARDGGEASHAYMIIVTWRTLEDMSASRSDVDMVLSAVLSQLPQRPPLPPSLSLAQNSYQMVEAGGLPAPFPSGAWDSAGEDAGGDEDGGGGDEIGLGLGGRAGVGAGVEAEGMRCEGRVCLGLKQWGRTPRKVKAEKGLKREVGEKGGEGIRGVGMGAVKAVRERGGGNLSLGLRVSLCEMLSIHQDVEGGA